MKSFVSLMVVGVMFLAGASAYADGTRSPFEAFRPDAAPIKASGELDLAGLKEMLTEMGIKPEQVEIGGEQALMLTVNHPTGKRLHVLRIEKESKNIVMFCIDHTSDASNASVGWYRAVAKINVALYPRAILVANDKVALQSATANHNLTSKELAEFMTKHIIAVEKVLFPVVNEL